MPRICDMPSPEDTATASSSPRGPTGRQLLVDASHLPPKRLKRHHYLTPETSTGSITPLNGQDTTAGAERPAESLDEAQVCIKPGHLTSPPSQHVGWKPPSSVVTEAQAINDLRVLWNSEDHSQDDFNIWRLEHFGAYRVKTDPRLPGEFAPLHHLNVETRVHQLLFDGVLNVHGEKRLVQGVPFSCVTVDGYGDDSDSVSICIQSKLGFKANVWFELGVPAPDYVRYHEPYLWIARFGKYFVEWLTADQESTLKSFRSHFLPFVAQRYEHSLEFQAWLSQCGSQDLRQALCANVGYLFKECWGLDKTLTERSIWQEVDPQRLGAIAQQPLLSRKTVVTPFVADCFRNMPFASRLQLMHDGHLALTLEREQRRTELGLTPVFCKPTRRPAALRPVKGAIRQGDVICVEADTASRWKTSEGSRWYAYVQGVRISRKGQRNLDLIWLYEPHDTTLGKGYYPWGNELFFSDNCSCGKDALDASDVIFKVDVRWFVDDPNAQACFFVRKKFRTEHSEGSYDFVQLKRSDFRCSCSKEEELLEFEVGTAVLVQEIFNGESVLEPAEILEYSKQSLVLRRFRRCRRDLQDLNARPNQIVPTVEPCITRPDIIVRKCKIAYLSCEKDLKSPYDKDGAGDFWFVQDQDGRSPYRSASGFSTSEAKNKLRGMGIFCGGGSFDRGLEEGGGVAFKWGVDWAKHALHTYRANLEDPQNTHLWLGSVNDYLAKAFQGSADLKIAGVGEVDMIAAGSPCPGFSVLQQHKYSDESLENCSLVASVCAYVDFYMPLYLILENVLGMAQNVKGKEDQNVCSQILCCLTAMGYQVQQFLMDPGHFGSCQSRSRIFIVATAPKLTPLSCPPQTHFSPQLGHRVRSIGRSSNGLRFGERRNDTCPFRFLSAKEALSDLPDINDGHVQTCIEFPDHRLCRQENVEKRALMSSIPRWPHGQGFMQAYLAGVMPLKQVQKYAWQNKNHSHPQSKSWARVYPDRLVGCITTCVQPADAFKRVVHYDQPRTLSVMEARRVQSFLDNEVVVGSPAQQWKIIGNSVDRKVAFALGLRLAEAWDKSNDGRWPQTQIPKAPLTVQEPAEIIEVDDAVESSETDAMEVIVIDDSDDPMDTEGLDEPVEVLRPRGLDAPGCSLRGSSANSLFSSLRPESAGTSIHRVTRLDGQG